MTGLAVTTGSRRRSNVPRFAAIVACGTAASWTSADIIGLSSTVQIAEPPATIFLDQWESDTEIRVWLERELVLPQSINVGHAAPGNVDDQPDLVNKVIPAGTQVASYMVRLDPVGEGPVLLSGFLTFDRPIAGVYIGSQLGPTDDLLGRPGIQYNQNAYRGLELDGPGGESLDMFEIIAGSRQIFFTMDVGDWTDDIRVVVYEFVASETCDGDANNDASIDIADLQLVLSAWGTSVPPGANGDVNFDGFVDIGDLNEVLTAWAGDC